VNGQTFDFNNKKLLDCSDGVIRNSSFTFTVSNINTFKYKVLLDSKPINNNMDIPDLIKKYMLKIDSAKVYDKGGNKRKDVKTYDDLESLYLKLKTAEQFYNGLVELLGSELSPEKILLYKKIYYQQFMGSDPIDDISDAIGITQYYRTLMDQININAQGIKFDTKESSKQVAIDSIYSYTRRIELSGLPQKLASTYIAINEQTFSVKSFIPRPNADDLILSITAKPNPVYNKNGEEIKIDIPFMVKGGCKIDFSTGIFFSNIVDKEFVNKPNYLNDSITGYNLIQADKNSLGYGIAGYIHAYWRTACNMNLSFTAGVGIDQNTQVKFMPGISLILGRNERLIINGGFAIGKQKVLSNVQDENHLYKEKVDPVYTETFKKGWFLGISYNLSKPK